MHNHVQGVPVLESSTVQSLYSKGQKKDCLLKSSSSQIKAFPVSVSPLGVGTLPGALRLRRKKVVATGACGDTGL